jgi:hypothetical protein
LYKAESVLKIHLKIPKVTDNKEIEVVWERFTNARSKNIHTLSPMVQSEALTLAKSLRNNQFKASTAWLDSFKKRHNTVWNRVCGESKDFEPAAALLVVRNTQSKDVEEEEEGGEGAAGKQDTSTKIALH